MTIASVIFIIAFLLGLLGDRLSRTAETKRAPGDSSKGRLPKIIASLSWATVGGACLAMSIITARLEVWKGLRSGTIQSADHPFIFWTIVSVLFLASCGVILWNVQDCLRALKREDAEAR